VHTGQNYDYELNGVFFEDLGLRRPDHFLEADTSSLGAVLGTILIKMEQVLLEEKPDAMLVLGDTNSCISALMARRLKIPVFHMEAGNRCFDENVPEEVNRRLVDHVSDYNLVYTEHARRNLLAEGIHPSRILLTGSPMREVLEGNQLAVSESDVMIREELHTGEFFLVSLHREENVDNSIRLTSLLKALNALAETYDVPVLVSTHPRTKKRLQSQAVDLKSNLRFHAPFGFNDYIRLQTEAKLVLSDSGTISEECSILGFRAVTLRDFIERPEALDAGIIITAGVETTSILDAVAIALASPVPGRDVPRPAEYSIANTSLRTLNFIRSTTHSHRARTGIRSDC
jgi:UDP-N-acetylglucosamine 2-epimerase (non-hydrolysing)